MKKFLFTVFAVAAILAVNAKASSPENVLQMKDNYTNKLSTNTFKGKYMLGNTCYPHQNIDIKSSVPSTRSTDEMVTDPVGTKTRYAMSVDIFLSHMGATHVGGFGAEGITSDDGKHFYTKALTLNFFQQGYSEGEIDGDRIVFKSGQYVYNTENNEKAYMYGAVLEEEDGWPVITESFVLTKDEQGRYVSAPDCYMLILSEDQDTEEIDATTEFICFGCNYVFTPLPADIKENKLPADAEIHECQFVGNSLMAEGQMAMLDITVGVSGDNIYIGGLSDYLPETYLMGTKTGEDTYTFDTDQYIGYFDEGDYPYIYSFSMVNPLYFTGDDLFFQAAESVTMTFNEDKSLLTLEEDAGIFICAYADFYAWDEAYWNIKIGDFNQPLIPSAPKDVNCYGSYGSTYMTFQWDDISVEGFPLTPDKLWCEVIINGNPYQFTPEYYEGLSEPTDRLYYSTSGIDGIYPGNFSTLYLYEFDGKFEKIKYIGVRFGYDGKDEIRYSDIVYANGLEPIEDKAFTPSSPTDLVYYKDYYSNFRFKFDGKDTDGKDIPARLLAVEILLDGKPLVFKDSEYYLNGGDGADVTMIGLSENSINYSSSIVSDLDGEYIISLWGHSELPEFKNVAIRAVCLGGDTLTYGDSCDLYLEREAIPANPWDVKYDEDANTLSFGALPIDTENEGLAPWNYGYEVYINDNLFVFDGNLYDLENDITFIPYEGFEYNYNFYLTTDYIYNETDWSIIDQKMVMEVSINDEDLNIQKIGVRAVYTDGKGKTTYSEIVNSDGSSGTSSVTSAAIDEDEPVKLYNLQGVEVASPTEGGIYIVKKGSKVSKVAF